MKVQVIVVVMMLIGVLIIAGIGIYSEIMPEPIVMEEPITRPVEEPNEPEAEPEPEVVVIDEADFVPGPVVEFEALSKGDSGVMINSKIKLTHFEAVTKEDIMSNLSFSPERDFDVSEISADSYEISFLEALPRDTLVKVKYYYEGKLYGDSFITEPNLKVDSTYPAAGSYGVEPNSIIEIKFNMPIDDGIKEFFSISPNVKGELEVADDILRFIPKNNLQYDERYTVTINEGYELKELALEKLEFTFSTVYHSSFWFGGSGIAMLPIGDTQKLVYNAWDRDLTNELGKIRELPVYKVTENIPECIALDDTEAIIAGLEDGTYGEFYKNVSVSHYEMDYYGYYFMFEEELEEGLYYTVVGFSETKKGTFMQATRKSVYFSADSDEVLVWIKDKEAGSVPGQLYADGELVGEVDPSGFAVFDYKMEQEKETLVVVETADETMYMPMYVGKSNEDLRYQIYSFIDTDREIYRESDTIYVNGYLDDRRGYDISDARLEYTVEGLVVATEDITLSPNGTFETSYSYEDLKHHSIYINLYVDGEWINSESCYITDFEKPSYLLETSLSETMIFSGEEITLHSQATYYDGTPLTNSEVKADFRNQSYAVFSKNGSTVTTDYLKSADGTSNQTYVVKSTKSSWYPHRVNIYTNVENLQNTYLYGSDSFYLFPKNMMVEGDVVGQGTDRHIEVSCHELTIDNLMGPYDYDGMRSNPVTDKSVSVAVKETYYEKVFIEQRYDSVYKIQYNVYDYVKHESTVYTNTGVTDSNGMVTFDFNDYKEGRYYSIKLQTSDLDDRSVYEEFSYSSRGWNNYSSYYDEGLWLNSKVTKSQYDQSEDDYYYNSSRAGLGDEVTVSLTFNGMPIESESDQLLIIEERDGINYYHLSDDTSISFIFDENRLPDTQIKGVYFAGDYMYSSYKMTTGIYTKMDSLELNLDMEFDQEKYMPGDTVNYKITMTDPLGNATGGDVNVSVVDEAIFDLYEDDDNPLYDIYESQYYRNIIASYLITPLTELESMAECGGEGGSDSFRDNFVDTCFFENVVVDESGVYEGSFVLPDNITSWRVTGTGFSTDREVTKEVYNIASGLPFFVDVLYEDQYLFGDNIYISLKSSGQLSFIGEPIEYHGRILDSYDSVVYETEEVAAFGDRIHIQFGSPHKGDYTLEAWVSYTDENGDVLMDGVRHDFSVVDYIASYQMIVEEPLSTDLEVVHNNNISTISVFNDDARALYNELSYLSYKKWDSHELRSVVGQLAEIYREELFDSGAGDESDQYGSVYVNASYDGLIEPLVNGSDDVVMTARLLSIGMNDYLSSYMMNDLKRSYLENQNNDSLFNSKSYEKAIAYDWIGILLGYEDPVLLDEYAANWDDLPTLESKLILLQATLDAGKYSRGEQIYQMIANENDFSPDAISGTLGSNKEERELLTFNLLAALVKMERMDDAEKVYNMLFDDGCLIKPQYRVSEPERLIYLMHKEKPVLESKVVYSINGETKEYVVTYSDYLNLILTAQEADSFVIESFDGDLVVVKDFIGTSEDIKEVTPTITKTITPKNGGEALKVGDEVIVELSIINEGNSRYFQVQDVLPAGLTFKEVIRTPGTFLYGESMGQMVDLFGGRIWMGNGADYSGEITFKYCAIATAVGTYGSEPAVFSRYYEGKFWTSNEVSVDIEE